MADHYTNAPEIRCPRCRFRFDHGAHWEIQLDHTLECEQCGAVLKLAAEEALRRWTWTWSHPPSVVDKSNAGEG